jgi:hypothetical protein
MIQLYFNFKNIMNRGKCRKNLDQYPTRCCIIFSKFLFVSQRRFSYRIAAEIVHRLTFIFLPNPVAILR